MRENHKVKTQAESTVTNNGVVITVYVESLRTRSKKLSEHPNKKKTKPHPVFNVPRDSGTQGYDRRAELLAYSRQLRNEASSQKADDDHLRILLSRNQSQLKTKKRSPSTQILPSSSRHEPVEVESKRSKGVKRSKKRKGSGINFCYPFLRKLKNMLKKLSCKNW